MRYVVRSFLFAVVALASLALAACAGQTYHPYVAAAPQATPWQFAGSLTYNFGTASTSFNPLGEVPAGWAPTPSASGTYTATFTSASYDGVANAIAVAGNGPDEPGGTTYYTWTQNGSLLDLSYLGQTSSAGGVTETETCAAPYQTRLVIPLPSTGWNELTGSGPCTTAYSGVVTGTFTLNSDGSYTYSGSATVGTVTGTISAALDSPGNGSVVFNDPIGTSVVLSLPAVTSNTATIPVGLSEYAGALPSPVPSPSPTTGPNFWAYVQRGTGVEPMPLQSETDTLGANGSSQYCTIPSDLAGATLEHVTRSTAKVDPFGVYQALYVLAQTDTYYLPGVGPVCIVYNAQDVAFNGDIWQWFDGSDQAMTTYLTWEADSLTDSSLAALLKQSHSMTEAVSRASALFTAASNAHFEGLVRSRMNARKRGLLSSALGSRVR
jgi:hypothetical protein